MPQGADAFGYGAIKAFAEFGVSQGKKIQKRQSRVQDLYDELSSNPKFKLKNPSFRVKEGTTLQQVREAFEVSTIPATGRPVSQSVLDSYAKALPAFQGAKEGEWTQNDVSNMLRLHGIETGVEKTETQTALAIMRMKLSLATDFAELGDVDKKRLKSNYKSIFNFITNPNSSLEIKDLPSGFGKSFPTIAEKIRAYVPLMGSFGTTPGLGTPDEAPLPPPSPSPQEPGDEAINEAFDEFEKIHKREPTEEEAEKILMDLEGFVPQEQQPIPSPQEGTQLALQPKNASNDNYAKLLGLMQNIPYSRKKLSTIRS